MNQKVWLPEASYELNLTAQTPETPNPLKTWRERVSNGTVSGAFQVNITILLTRIETAKRNEACLSFPISACRTGWCSLTLMIQQAEVCLSGQDVHSDSFVQHNVPSEMLVMFNWRLMVKLLMGIFTTHILFAGY